MDAYRTGHAAAGACSGPRQAFAFVTRVTDPALCRNVGAGGSVLIRRRIQTPSASGIERGTAEGEVVLGAPPPARPLRPRQGPRACAGGAGRTPCSQGGRICQPARGVTGLDGEDAGGRPPRGGREFLQRSRLLRLAHGGELLAARRGSCVRGSRGRRSRACSLRRAPPRRSTAPRARAQCPPRQRPQNQLDRIQSLRVRDGMPAAVERR